MDNLPIREPQPGSLDKRRCRLQTTSGRWSNILQSFQRSWVVNIYRIVLTILLSLACTFDRLSVCPFFTLTRPLDPNKDCNGDFCLLYNIAAVSLIPSHSHIAYRSCATTVDIISCPVSRFNKKIVFCRMLLLLEIKKSILRLENSSLV